MASSASSTMAASHRSTRRSTDPSAADRTITIAASSGRIPGNDEADGAAAAAVAGTLTTQGRNDAVAGHGEGGGDGGDGQEQRVHALLEQVEDCGKNLRGHNRDRFRRGLGGLRREFAASAGRVRRLAADNGALTAENLSLSERVRILEARLAACSPACSESDGDRSGNDATDGIGTGTGTGTDTDIKKIDPSNFMDNFARFFCVEPCIPRQAQLSFIKPTRQPNSIYDYLAPTRNHGACSR